MMTIEKKYNSLIENNPIDKYLFYCELKQIDNNTLKIILNKTLLQLGIQSIVLTKSTLEIYTNIVTFIIKISNCKNSAELINQIKNKLINYDDGVELCFVNEVIKFLRYQNRLLDDLLTYFKSSQNTTNDNTFAINIPKEYAVRLGLNGRNPITVFQKDNMIIIEKTEV